MNDAAPERIWLQDAGDYAGARDHGEVTWCQGPIDPDDTEYLRADLHLAALAARDARIAALEAGLRDAAEALDRAAGELAEFALILSREPTEANRAWRAANDAGFAVTAKARALLDGGEG